MIQFMKFKRKKAKMNTDLLKGFAAPARGRVRTASRSFRSVLSSPR